MRTHPSAGRSHLRSGVLLVGAGGVVGTAARYGTAVLLNPAPASGWPWGTFVVNLAGSLALGWLLEALARCGPESSRQRRIRLGLGTGVLGGFTTYSSLALEVDQLLPARPVLAVGYAAVSLVVGLLACALGVALGARGRPPAAPTVPEGDS